MNMFAKEGKEKIIKSIKGHMERQLTEEQMDYLTRLKKAVEESEDEELFETLYVKPHFSIAAKKLKVERGKGNEN